MPSKLNICAIVGTMHRHSNTGYFVREFIKALQEQASYTMEYEIFNLYDYHIEQCVGCNSCVRSNQCMLNDDMELLKKRMVEADLVIWATPVYMNNVSGIMKTFIDRLHMWTKVLFLAGKHSIVLSTSSHEGGNLYVQEYLENIFTSLGAVNLGKYNICVDFPKELYNPDKEGILLQHYAESVLESLKENYLVSTPLHEMIFKSLQSQISSLNPADIINNYIPEYWREKDMLEHESYQEYLDKVRRMESLCIQPN